MSAQGQEPTQQDNQGQEPNQGGQEPQGGAGQEPEVFDAAYVQNLRREAARHRAEAATLKQQVRDHEQAQMTEQQKLESRVSTAEAGQQKAELALARYEIAAAKDIPGNWVKFLVGATREELEANADELKRQLDGMGQASSHDFGGGARPNGGNAEEDFNRVLRRSAGRPN